MMMTMMMIIVISIANSSYILNKHYVPRTVLAMY